MIRTALLLSFLFCPAVAVGQCGSYYGPSYYGPPIVYDSPIIVQQPPMVRYSTPVREVRVLPTLELYLGEMREETREYKWVRYDNQFKRVPVINGIAPAIRRYPNSSKITLRYDIGRPLAECTVYGETKPQQARQSVVNPPTEIPRDIPSPEISPQSSPYPPPSDGTKKPSNVDAPERTIPPSYDRNDQDT